MRCRYIKCASCNVLSRIARLFVGKAYGKFDIISRNWLLDTTNRVVSTFKTTMNYEMIKERDTHIKTLAV